MRTIVALCALAGLAAAAHAGEPLTSFHEETLSAGIRSAYAGEWEYMVGGGAAVFDCDDDGFADLFLAGGADPAKFYRNVSKRGGPIRFEEAKSGLEIQQATGAYPLDVDADGKADLVILRLGENIVMRGLGGCRFERANEAWSFDGGDAWSTSLAATWEKGGNWPTIAIGNYVNRFEDVSPWGSCTDNWLHRPAGSERRFAPPLALNPSYCPLSLLFTDWDRSGTPSLRMSNDREYYEGGQEQLWRVAPGEPPRLYTQAEGWRYLRIWGMGIASYDFDSDGYADYLLTSMADNKLQTLSEVPKDGKLRPDYKDVAFKKGVTAHRPYTGGEWRPSTAWHTQIEDVNNDGLADIFIAKGNVAEMPDFAQRDPNNLLLQKPDGAFEEWGERAGVASLNTARGGALADFNLDGRLDLVVVNRWVNAELWRNTTRDAGNWVQFRLEQDGPNRDAIGAWVEVKCGASVMRREIVVGGGHASGQLGWIHFGLGQETQTEIRVQWPDGEWSKPYVMPADGFAILKRSADTAEPWQPR